MSNFLKGKHDFAAGSLGSSKSGLSSYCFAKQHSRCKGFKMANHGLKPECRCQCHKKAKVSA